MRSMWRLGSAIFCGLAMLRAGTAWAASAPSWESVPSMITPRGEHTATELQDGRVLVTGGYPLVDAPPYTSLAAMSLREVEIYDPATRTWSPAAPLAQPRSGHAATLLPNGRVLVAGGRSRREVPSGAALASVELYDPTSNTWTTAAPLPRPHPAPSMVLVDGRPVLVGSGLNDTRDSDQFNSATYDPASDRWTALPNCFNVERIAFVAGGIIPMPVSATLLDDGRLMAVGGGCSRYDRETELWTWEQNAVMRTSEYRYPHATTLPGGDVLVVGGTLSGPDPQVHAFAQVYLPRDDRWEPTSGPYAPASTPCGRGSLGIRGTRTALLPSGKVLLTGGMEPCRDNVSTANIFPFFSTMALFDEATRAWSPLDLEPPVTMARAYHSSTPLRDGSVLIAGGYVDVAAATASAVLFRERSPLGEGCAADSDCGSGFCADSVCCDAACAGPCDACAVAAGAPQDGVCAPLTGVACDDADACVAGGVCEAGACVGGEAAPDGTPCSDGDVCSAASACVGGACVGSSLDVCLPADACHEAPACDPAAGCALPGPARPDGTPCGFPGAEEGWQETGRLDTLLYDAEPTELPDGTVLVVGSSLSHGRGWTRYDPSTDAWEPFKRFAERLYIPRTPTLLPDGTVMVIDGGSQRATSRALRFDAATGVWLPAASLHLQRMTQTATALADGRVLVVGGDRTIDGGGERVEIYDPVADTWTEAAPMSARREYHTATLLPDGRVLVTGGLGGDSMVSASAEVYSPATDTWTPATSMRRARAYHTATLLLDGRVLVVGGDRREPANTAETYDPASDTWTSAGEMATERWSHRAELLLDGRVLVTGEALSSDGALAAEIYDPASGTWALAPALDVMISRHGTVRLSDGRVLLVGGRAGPRDGYQALNHAWLYVPAQPASAGACQSGACVPGEGGGGTGGDASGGGGGTGGDASGGGGGTGGDASGGGGGTGGDASGGGGGTGGDASGGGGGTGGDASGGGGGTGGDASGGGGAGGTATGGLGGDASGGGNESGGGAPNGGGGNASGEGGAGGDGGNASGEGGAGGTATGGHGGDAGDGGDAPSTTTSTTGAGGANTTSTSASATSAQSSGGALPTAGGGGGCRMTPGDNGTPAWLLALGALATLRLRRRLPRTSRPA
ncbi:Kelch repeat-containing protein [Sorangium sp. So ce1151]|uniref:Kelch repeat-containing protein n=1 Tax=Sorangium sp. So ce1151 TaxID=3133332 RepID=UPI003F5DD899